MGFHIFRLLYIILVATILFHGACYSDKAGHYTFMKDAIIAPTYARFDYIVTGGGTSGCAFAATLSQNASVLVLERGGSPYDNPTATDLANLIPSSWSQPFTSKDGVDNKRPRVLGGGTVINGGFYTRAEDDYVAEAKLEMEEVETAYEWIEKKLVFEPQVTGWQSAFINGLLEADVAPYNGFTYDHINGTKIGGTIFDISGHRHSAADLLEYANPDMIAVYVNATVHKILLFTTEEEGKVVDLQDVFVRFMFDTTLVTVTGSADPRSLSIEMPEDGEFAKALNDVGEGIMYRHVKPRFLWKLQRWFGFGQEKKRSKANDTLNRICERFISAKREEIRSRDVTNNSNGEGEDLLTCHMKLDATKYELLNPSDDKFLRDTILSFILAGRDAISSALTWFFWILSVNVTLKLSPRFAKRSTQLYQEQVAKRGHVMMMMILWSS